MSDNPPQVPAKKAALAHMDALPAGTMLGEFEVQGLLGVGGFGMVYRGFDHSLQRQVAIKEYMPSALVGRVNQLQVVSRSSSDAKPFQVGLKSFIAEARLLARFDHPSLVKVYRFWEANNTAYMAMPLYSGITLKQARSQMSGPPPEAWLRTVLWSLLEALKVLHGSNTLHRDVSPDNVFLQDIGPPVLLDLGAARRAISEGNQKHTAILKVNYAPIEQYADAEELREGPWTDLYAVAAVVHGCLSNTAPMPATIRVVKDGLPKIAQLADTAARHFATPYGNEFVRAIDRALSLQPAERQQSVDQFCEEMVLLAPPDLSHFDWRQALGAHTQLNEPVTEPGALTTQVDTVVDDRTQLIDQPGGQATVVVRAPARASRKRRDVAASTEVAGQSKSFGWWRTGLLVGLVIVLLVLGFAKITKTREHTLPVNAIPVVTSPESQQPASAPATVASEVVIEAAPQRPVQLPEQPVSKPVAKKPPTTVASPPVPVAAPAPRQVVENSAKSQQADSVPRASEPSVAPSGQAAGTQELCASSNFVARPMCIYRECQKPENEQLSICIESRKKWESNDKPR
jgi:serine/threonine protein kinase